MMKIIFNYITSFISISDNPLLNFGGLLIIGYVAYLVSYFLVGETYFRGIIASELHWTIRFIIFVIMAFILYLLLKIYEFIVNNFLNCFLAFILLNIFFVLYLYCDVHPDSFLNKKII